MATFMVYDEQYVIFQDVICCIAAASFDQYHSDIIHHPIYCQRLTFSNVWNVCRFCVCVRL